MSRDGRRAVLEMRDVPVVDSFQFFGPNQVAASVSFRIEWRATGPFEQRGSGVTVPPEDAAAFLGRLRPRARPSDAAARNGASPSVQTLPTRTAATRRSVAHATASSSRQALQEVATPRPRIRPETGVCNRSPAPVETGAAASACCGAGSPRGRDRARRATRAEGGCPDRRGTSRRRSCVNYLRRRKRRPPAPRSRRACERCGAAHLAAFDGDEERGEVAVSLIAAAGMALAFIPSHGTAISSARPEEGGLASGIVNTSYQVGSALGLATMTALAASQGAGRLGDLPALTDGYSAAFLGAAGIALAGRSSRSSCREHRPPRRKHPRRPPRPGSRSPSDRTRCRRRPEWPSPATWRATGPRQRSPAAAGVASEV